jgi:transcriptional regulator with XRE-family HTH domain
MDITLEGMTLQTLLRQHGITTIRELTHRTGLSRQQCWNLWHGQAGVGKETLKRLHERLNIPLEALLEVDPVPRRKRPAKGSQQRQNRAEKKGQGGSVSHEDQ